MEEQPVDPHTLIGDRVVGVTVGWHVYEGEREAARYILRLSTVAVEPTLHGNGSLDLVATVVPADFDMQEHGRYEFREDTSGGALTRLVGRAITGVAVIRRGGVDVGVRLRSEDALAVLANVGDEVFVSGGERSGGLRRRRDRVARRALSAVRR